MQTGCRAGHPLEGLPEGAYLGASSDTRGLYAFMIYTSAFFAVSPWRPSGRGHARLGNQIASKCLPHELRGRRAGPWPGLAAHVCCALPAPPSTLLGPPCLPCLQVDVLLNLVTGVYDEGEQRVVYSLRHTA